MKTGRHRLLSALAAVSIATGTHAQSNIDAQADAKPVLDLMHHLFALSKEGQLGSPEGQSLRSGEMAKAKITAFGAMPDPDKVIKLTGGAAVVRIPAVDQRPDLYLFVARSSSGSWTWTSYRALALTSMLEYLRNELRKKSTLTTEETITLRNLELTLSSDKKLIAWFASHRADLDAIRVKTQSKKTINSRDKDANSKQLASLGLLLSTLTDDAVSITIGGMVDNEVGFMFAPPKKVPEIGADRYIWIEPLGDGWYLYKTT